MKQKQKNNFLVQGTILAASSILVRFIGLLYRIPLTKIIGDEGMGCYSSAYEIYSLALILSSYSIPLAVSKLVSEREIKKEYKNSYRVFTAAMSAAILIGGIASLLVFGGAELLAKLVAPDNYKSVAIPLRILSPTIFIFAVLGVLRGLFQGKRTMLPTAVSQVLEQIVNAFISVIAASFLMKMHNASPNLEAYGAAGGTLGTFTGALAALAFLGFIYFIYRPVLKKKLKKDTKNQRETYKGIMTALAVTIFPIILSQGVYQLSGTLDNIMFGQLMSSNNIDASETMRLYGIYYNKYRQLTNLPVAVATALGTAIVPTLSAALAQKDLLGMKRKIAYSSKLNMLVSIPAAVGMAVLAQPILIAIFNTSSDVVLSAQLLRIGSIAIIFFSFSTMTNGVLQGIGKMKLPVIHAAISLGVHVVLLFLLLKVLKMGAYGLVIGNITYALLVCILNWIAVSRYAEYRQEIARTFLIPSAASIVMGLTAYFSYKGLYAVSHSNLISLIISVCLAVTIYGIVILLLKGVSEAELLGIPKGAFLVRIFKRIHLL